MTKDILSIAVEIFTIAIGLLFVGLNLLLLLRPSATKEQPKTATRATTTILLTI